MPCKETGCDAAILVSIDGLDVRSRQLCATHTAWHFGNSALKKPLVFEGTTPKPTPWLNPEYGRATPSQPTKSKKQRRTKAASAR